MKTAKTTLQLCIQKLQSMAKADPVYTDEIPEVLQEDFRTFIVGHSLSTYNGREITYDLNMYIQKILDKGLDYYVSWELHEFPCIAEHEEFVENILVKRGLQYIKSSPGYFWDKTSVMFSYICDVYIQIEISTIVGKHQGWHK